MAPRFLAFLATKIAYETNKPGRYARPRHAVLRDRSRPLDPLMVPRRRCLLYSCSCGCLSRVDHVQAAAAARVGRAAAALAGCRCASRRHLEPRLDPAPSRGGGSAGTFSDPRFRAACAPSVQCGQAAGRRVARPLLATSPRIGSRRSEPWTGTRGVGPFRRYAPCGMTACASLLWTLGSRGAPRRRRAPGPARGRDDRAPESRMTGGRSSRSW